MKPTGFVPLSQSLSYWPSDLIGQPAFLDQIGIRDFQMEEGDNLYKISGDIIWFKELELPVPGLDGVSLAFLCEDSKTVAAFEVEILPEFAFRLPDLGMAVRLSTDLLRPVKKVQGKWVLITDVDGKPVPLEIKFDQIGIGCDQDGDFTIEMPGSIPMISAGPVQIGDTGIVLEIEDINLHLSRKGTPPPGAPQGFRGVSIGGVKLHFPDDFVIPMDNFSVIAEDLFIGTGGLSGTIQGEGNCTYDSNTRKFTGTGSGELFGIPFGITSVGFSFRQNVPSASSISGQVLLPFFDQPVGVEIGIGVNGTLNISLAEIQPDGVTNQNGLITLEKEDLLRVTIDSLGIEFDKEGVTFKLSGEITPLYGDIEWPSFSIKELAIDSEGNVKLEGGWLNLKDQYSIDFYGFKLEITRLGFGKTGDGGKWVGFSGGLKLVDGFQAGASVEGLRITWYEDDSGELEDIKVSFNGVGVEFEVPDVLHFKGAVSFNTLSTPEGPVRRFDGDIKLNLMTLGLQVDAKLVIGSTQGYNFFAIYLGVELPAGIPLWATGLGLYGMAGLFALQMEPNKGAPPNELHPASREDEGWYENGDGSPGWYKRNPIGVTDLKSKWDPQKDSLALGAGITIGTLSDNGFAFSGKMLLAIVFPGPILLIEGKANILKERSKLDEEPIFRSLAVLDNRAGIFQFGLDAKYKYGEEGELIDIRGGVDAFFNLNDPGDWYLHIGKKDPRNSRIVAEIFKLFNAESYFMLEPDKLEMGAWTGYDKKWKFGPLKVVLEAWLDTGAAISWKPAHFYGYISLHGKVGLSVFGYGTSLWADANLEADVFDPFHIKGTFNVGIELPWPLPDFEEDVSIEWGPELTPPPLPLPLKEVAIEHFKTTTSWPLAGGNQLLPDYDPENNGYINEGVNGDSFANSRPPADIPVVPLDCRPHITFGRPVNDDAKIGGNSQLVEPEYEWIGNPARGEGPVKVRYGLKEVYLDRWDEAKNEWKTVAVAPEQEGYSKLYGSWAPIPDMSGGDEGQFDHVKLWLWSKTPFDYTRTSGHTWDEWFTDRYDHYPCPTEAPDKVVCSNFEKLLPGTKIFLPWSDPEVPEIVILRATYNEYTVEELAESIDGLNHGVAFGGKYGVHISLRQPVKEVKILLQETLAASNLTFIDFKPLQPGKGSNPRRINDTVFQVYDHNGVLMSYSRIDHWGNLAGLNCGFKLKINLPSTDYVELTLTRWSSIPTVMVYDGSGQCLDTAQMVNPQGEIETIRFQKDGIESIIIKAPGNELLLHSLCYRSSSVCPVRVAGFLGEDKVIDSFETTDNLITLQARGIDRIRINSKCSICLVQICANLGPDLQKIRRRQEMVQHITEELGRWSMTDYVLNPHTIYRLKLVTTVNARGVGDLSGFIKDLTQTEYAYFQTDGPPGLAVLSKPAGSTDSESLEVFKDLNLYVEQTIPPTVPETGEKPVLPGPVYRAYDVGVIFNETYVDLMYRLDQRDLMMYLYDNNNQIVRDPQGRVIIFCNQWGKREELTLKESEIRWITTVNASSCVTLPPDSILHDKTLTAAYKEQVMDADTVYEARLIPLLLHDDFTSGMAGWTVIDEGTNDSPSNWDARGHDTLRGKVASSNAETVTLIDLEDISILTPELDVVILKNDTARSSRTYGILSTDTDTKKITVDGRPVIQGGVCEWEVPAAGALFQRSNIWGNGDLPLSLPGTMLVRGDVEWTDYCFSVVMRTWDNDAMGIVFRYRDSANYYHFYMDRERMFRRLVKVVNGNITLLASDDFIFNVNQDYLVTVEALGSSIRIYQDNEPVFKVTDGDLLNGKIGLYCWGNEGVRFSDLRVDDLRPEAPVVYKFKFTTSWFANFFHHLHSYQDETWFSLLPENINVGTFLAKAVSVDQLPLEIEGATYEEFVHEELAQHDTLKVIIGQKPAEIQITRFEQDERTIGYLVQNPEPIDWKRTELEVLYTTREVKNSRIPGEVKLTGLTFGENEPNEETVEILLRQTTDLTGYEIQYKCLPDPVFNPVAGKVIMEDYFSDKTGPVEPGDPWEIHDEGGNFRPSRWNYINGKLKQTSNIYTDNDPDYSGTYVVSGEMSWDNYRMTVRMKSDDDDAIGVIFRYQDSSNYYRFSLDAQRKYRRLIKKENGVVSILWEDNVGFTVGQAFTVTIDAIGSWIKGYQGGVKIFQVQDDTFSAGKVGLYTWGNTGAQFEWIQVCKPSLEAYALFKDDFANGNLNQWEVVDEGPSSAPSKWEVKDGILHQTSNIYEMPIDRDTLSKKGTQIVAGQLGWRDILINIRLKSTDDDAVGLVFRYKDQDNYYRFSMDSQRKYRRLVKNVNGVFKLLWEDSVSYEVNRFYEVTVVLKGSQISGYIDGIPVFNVQDDDLVSGRIGLYCWGNEGSEFSDVLVLPIDCVFDNWYFEDDFETLEADRWVFEDSDSAEVSSSWDVVNGMLQQKSLGGLINGWKTCAYALATFSGGDELTSINYGSGNTRTTGADVGQSVESMGDYRISTQVICDRGSSGILARYQSRDNYYCFIVNRRDKIGRFSKVLNGISQIIWEDEVNFDFQDNFVMVLDCVGSKFTGYLNGVQLFEVNDSTMTSGQIGLYCEGTMECYFNQVRVAPAVWASFYRFGKEEILPVGKRIRIYSGNEKDEHAGESGILKRFAAAQDDKGRLKLAVDGVEMKVKAPEKNKMSTTHSRYFLPENYYNPVDVKLLRKADGTNFFILASKGDFAKGQYRLKFTYHRDNRSNDPLSPVFRQGGNSEPEVVVIDVPWGDGEEGNDT